MPPGAALIASLPKLQPADPSARLLLFAVRQMGRHGLDDACAAHAFVTAFGGGFRRPLVLARALMAEMARVSLRPVQIAPWCCPRMTASENMLLTVLGHSRARPEAAHLLLADMLGVREAGEVLSVAEALAETFAEAGLPLDR